MRISRRQLLRGTAGLAAGAAVSAVYPFYMEPRLLDVTTTAVPCPGIARGKRVRVLQLTDLHASPENPFSVLEEAVNSGLQAKPDLICLTGDYITRELPEDGGRYQELLARLPAVAPTYGVLGNHDGGVWSLRSGGYPSGIWVANLLERAGVRVLHNQSVRVSAAGTSVQLVGVGDLWSREVNPAAFRNVDPSAGSAVVLLAHNPDTKDVLRAQPWHLMLSGHTHGGQIRIPGYGAPIVPVKDKRFVEGLHAWEDRRLYISRGVGGVLMGVRFACRPEVTVLDLVAPETSA